MPRFSIVPRALTPAAALAAFLTALLSGPADTRADAVISGPPCIVDCNTIQIGEKRKKGVCWGGIAVRLHSSIAPDLDTTCTDSGGRTWPCGQEAKAAMSKIIRLKEIVCYHVDGEFMDGIPLTTCISGRNDVASQMIRRGMAKNPPEHQRYKAEEDHAKERRLGLWK